MTVAYTTNRDMTCMPLGGESAVGSCSRHRNERALASSVTHVKVGGDWTGVAASTVCTCRCRLWMRPPSSRDTPTPPSPTLDIQRRITSGMGPSQVARVFRTAASLSLRAPVRRSVALAVSGTLPVRLPVDRLRVHARTCTHLDQRQLRQLGGEVPSACRSVTLWRRPPPPPVRTSSRPGPRGA